MTESTADANAALRVLAAKNSNTMPKPTPDPDAPPVRHKDAGAGTGTPQKVIPPKPNANDTLRSVIGSRKR